MLIASWSPYSGQAGVTSNSIAIAVELAIRHNIRVLITHTHTNKLDMERAFLNINEEELIGSPKVKDTGLDAACRNAQVNRLNTDTLQVYTDNIIEGRLDLLAGTLRDKENLSRDHDINVQKVLRCAVSKYDVVVVDLNSGTEDSLTKMILDKADIILLNVSQNYANLKEIFIDKKYSNFINKDKQLVVVGRYESKSTHTIKYMKNTFRLKETVFGVPYCSDFNDAINGNYIVRFLKTNSETSSNNVNNILLASFLGKLSDEIAIRMGLNISDVSNSIKQKTLKEQLSDFISANPFSKKGGRK